MYPVFLFLPMSLKRFLIFLIGFIVVSIAALLLLRGYFLEKAILKIQQKVEEKFDAKLVIENAAFEGLGRIALTNVTLLPANGDTLFSCSKTAVSISILRLLKGQPPINNIIATHGFIRLRENPDSTNNFSFLLKGDETPEENPEKENQIGSYQKQAEKLWNRFFDVADFNFSIRDFLLSWQTPYYHENLEINTFTLDKSKFNFSAIDSLTDHNIGWEMIGVVDHSEEIISIEGKTVSGKSEEIPFFKKLTGIRFFINKFGLSISRDETSKSNLGLNLYVATVAPGINHWRISPEDVVLDSLKARINIHIDGNNISSGPETAFIINKLPMATGFSYEKNDSTVVAVKISVAEIPAQDFFNSLPKGLFLTLDGIKVKGNLNYNLNFHANLDDPENLVFDSQLKKSEFRITGYGNENFAAINGSFSYTAREKDVAVRTFMVGPENPNYTPLDQISPLLVNSVLTAEDGTFRFHNGFNEESFRKSIATNIREKRFARGGSTITMQLVKNVFLNRNKTVSRKVEEALIVWLIENNNLVSKDRLLEVYLNIIEWGPGVYGIGEASQFYFAKHPSALSLEESIYLSSIIPRPKTFKYTFDKEGNMKEYLKGYFDLVAGRLLKKEIITQQLVDSLHYTVELKGPALQMVVPTDSIPVDSLMIEEPEDLF